MTSSTDGQSYTRKDTSRERLDYLTTNESHQEIEAPVESNNAVADIEAKEETLPEPTEVKSNDRPYTIFSTRQKASIVLISTLGACFSGFTTNIYLPAIDAIAKALHVSVSKVNLTITTYMIFQGIAPSFISAVADVHGRRPAYVIGFTIYMLANLGLGLNNSYVGLLVLRCIQSCGSSGLVTLNQGTIADIITSAERGKYISITAISSVLAPSVAPIAGGALAQHLGWHSLFWFLLITSGVYFVPLVLFFPETGRKVVGDGSIRPPRWNRCLTDLIRERKGWFDRTDEADLQRELSRPVHVKRSINILAPFSIIVDPETALLLATMALMYAAFFAISTSLTVQFGRIYNLDSTLQGLLFLPQAVGSACAAAFNSKILDQRYRANAKRAGLPMDKSRQIDILNSPMPIERARLEIAIPMISTGCACIIVYGWLLNARVHIAGPIAMLLVTTFTFISAFSAINVLVVDLHRRRPATASAAGNLVRCLLGAGASAVINPMIEGMGLGWCFTFVGLTCLGSISLVLVCYFRGPQMRKKRSENEKRKAAEREERKQAKAMEAGGNRSWFSRK